MTDSSSPNGPLCRHFGECGGCASQDVPYAQQCAEKREKLAALIAPWWQGELPVHGSPALWYYRNKVDFTFAPKRYPEPPPKDFKRELVLGFKRQGRWYWPLDMEECRIADEHVGALLDAVRDWAKARDLEPFETRSKRGFLKILLVREGKRSGERMVVLVTRPGELDTEGFANAVLSAYPATSVQWAEHDSFSHAAGADRLHVLHGSDVIHEELHVPDSDDVRKLRFRISPMSFFQTNTYASEVLYGLLRSWVRDSAPRVLYDLYGGSGGIALTCADLVDHVYSVESVDAATADGVRNAAMNQVENVAFTTAPVRKYLQHLRDESGLAEDSLVILDPPRAGLHPKAMKRLLELEPKELVYVSCKPEQFAVEMETLGERYSIVDAQAVDLFPHTEHVELAVRLRIREDE